MADRAAIDRFVDIASVVLISAAAVLSALCGYQSGRWSGDQNRLYNAANGDRVVGAIAANHAMALEAIDVNVFLRYFEAMESSDSRRAQALYQRMRPNMRPALDAWLATKPLSNPHAPSSPFVMPQYERFVRTAGVAELARSGADSDAALLANRHADEFLLLTVIFAGVSFLAGTSTKMGYPRHAIVVGIGILALLYGVSSLVRLPFL